MLRSLSTTAVIGVAVIAVLYEFVAKSLIFDVLGYGRVVQNISAFNNVHCQKVDDLGLEACEDMWLNDRNGLLYMACSDTLSRTRWLPALVTPI
jgi:arylesterase/paraoxonase